MHVFATEVVVVVLVDVLVLELVDVEVLVDVVVLHSGQALHFSCLHLISHNLGEAVHQFRHCGGAVGAGVGWQHAAMSFHRSGEAADVYRIW